MDLRIVTDNVQPGLSEQRLRGPGFYRIPKRYLSSLPKVQCMQIGPETVLVCQSYQGGKRMAPDVVRDAYLFAAERYVLPGGTEVVEADEAETQSYGFDAVWGVAFQLPLRVRTREEARKAPLSSFGALNSIDV